MQQRVQKCVAAYQVSDKFDFHSKINDYSSRYVATKLAIEKFLDAKYSNSFFLFFSILQNVTEFIVTKNHLKQRYSVSKYFDQI